MLKESQWQAAKQLIMDLGNNPAEVDFLSLFGQLDQLIPLESCSVYRWQAAHCPRKVQHWVCLRGQQKLAFVRSATEEVTLDEFNKAMRRAGCSEPVESLILGVADRQWFMCYHRGEYLAAICKLSRSSNAAATRLALIFRARKRLSVSTANLCECVLPLAATYLELCTIQESAVSAAFGPRLTQREQQILQCITAGENTRRIAHSLRISERTVNYHLHNLYTKLGVRNRAEAAIIGMQLNDQRSVKTR